MRKLHNIHLSVKIQCSQCGIQKEVSEFNKDSRKKSGRRGYCKICQGWYKLPSAEREKKTQPTAALLEKLIKLDGFSPPPDQLYDRLSGKEDVLAEIAIVSGHPMPIRATAARIFSAQACLLGETGKISKRHKSLASDLLNHRMIAIQMGATIGMQDARNLETENTNIGLENEYVEQ